nr:hypothetical protein [Conyzicola lurida]
MQYYPELPRRPRRRGRGIAIGLVLALLVSGSVWAFGNRQFIADQLAAWTFEASPTITAYEERSTMTDHAALIFEASRPRVDGTDGFDSVCGSAEAGSGILGCYLPGTQEIVLYDVTDDKLDGIEEVVASHEMLHAAWDRLGDDEKARLEPLLSAEASALAGDAEFVARMELYASLEPGEHHNELHSIIGTEVGTLSPELEAYYARYFTDRQALIALHVASNAVFVDLQARSDALSAELDTLRASIDSDYAAYNAGYDALSGDIARFNERADSGDFASNAQFQREKNALVARQSALDAMFDSAEQRVETFNAKIAELESLNAQTLDLTTSLNIEPRTGGGLD